MQQRGNHPSIIQWVVFNEAWGQFDTETVTKNVMKLDPSRLVSLPGDITNCDGDICPQILAFVMIMMYSQEPKPISFCLSTNTAVIIRL